MDEMLKAARVVPRLAVGALALAIGVVLLWPWVEEKRAIERLSSVGLSWNAEEFRLRGATDSGTLDGLGASLRTLQPKAWNLSYSDALQNVDGLKGLTALATLDLGEIAACDTLENVDGLKGLTTLDLAYCRALVNGDGLKGLTALQTLDLGGCTSISEAALRELEVALPDTDITFPDWRIK